MRRDALPTIGPGGDFAALERELRPCLRGELRTDRLSRALYATDASIYEIVPDGVLLPKTADDIAAAVELCGRHGVPLTARGAGTGLTGAAVNRGLQVDCSRYLNRILAVDPAARTVRVEPGVVLDELNAALKPHGLHFAPDVATSSRATLGGMIAINSCGSRSILYGRTVDHVRNLDLVLADGSRCTWGRDVPPPDNPLAQQCEQVLAQVVTEHADEIAARYPKVLRSNGGYALDRVRMVDGRPNVETLLCGSEGTLAVVVAATLKLTPLPKCKGLLTLQFAELMPALEAVAVALEHAPAAVELIDDLILRATESNPTMAPRRWFVDGRPKAVLACELFDEEPERLDRRLRDLHADLRRRSAGTGYRLTTDAARQADVWELRKAGLGLVMSTPGDRQPYAFIEDAAVDPRRLPEYIGRLDQLLKDEQIDEIGYYAHASVGCLHVRPVLNLKRQDDIDRMRRIAERVSRLVCEFGGTISGEHGDGIVRSQWLELMYGPRILAAFGEIKRAFDPAGILNPGKIVDPLPMTDNLRLGAEYRTRDVPTTLDFSTYGGMAGLAEMCTGVGQCRQRLVGTMCPSYMATGDERHTTRARANALRMALSNRGLLDGLDDPALDAVMDLCLSCKACKTECPTGTDLARLKAEWLGQRNARRGVPRRARLIAASLTKAAWGCRLAPLSNWLMQAAPTRVLLEYLFGLDRRVPPPRFARTTFRQWFAQRGPRSAGAGPARRSAGVSGTPLPSREGLGEGEGSDAATAPPSVVYFVDTWTNFYEPHIGQAVVRVFEALGYNVIVPSTRCCGRPLISQGLLRDAAALAETNVALLAPYAERGIPIVVSEPSCLSTMWDEWPQLVRTPAARQVAAAAVSIETFVAAALRRDGASTTLSTSGIASCTLPQPLPEREGGCKGDRESTDSPLPQPLPGREGSEVGSPHRPPSQGGPQGGRSFRPPNAAALLQPLPGTEGDCGASNARSFLYHGHCHQKALLGTADAMELLTACSAGRAREINSGCCGMAGAFGHEVEHYDVAQAIGEQRLFPAIRARGDADVVASGFSCRQHIAHHTGVTARHVIEIVADALAPRSE